MRPTRVDLEHALTIFLGLYPEKERLSMLKRHFAGEELPPLLLESAAARESWFAERRSFLHPADDGSKWETAYQLAVDPECKELGVANDSLAFLDALAARLAKDVADPLAATLLARYVPNVAATELGAWLAKNRDELYFTEAGGWIWRVKGERASSPALKVTGTSADDVVNVKAEVTGTTLTITLRIREGWHLYTPDSKDPKAVRVAIASGSAFEAAGAPDCGEDSGAVLAGFCQIQLPLRRVVVGEALSVQLTYTACDAATCKPPKTVQMRR
jgi:hypothetical protein